MQPHKRTEHPHTKSCMHYLCKKSGRIKKGQKWVKKKKISSYKFLMENSKLSVTPQLAKTVIGWENGKDIRIL